MQLIKHGKYATMPKPMRAEATGPFGKGMTIENGTGHTLLVHFDGPITKTVEVPDRKSVGAELAVGSYEVAAEVPESSILPFCGIQHYEPDTHYWLKFYV